MVSISHTFAICAYKDSPYLEKCVRSVLNQKIHSEVIICTSTPSDYISNIADKYDIPVLVRNGKSDIKDDWNYAYNSATTKWVTVAHQDDVYASTYSLYLWKKIKNNKNNNLIFFTDYYPLKNDIENGIRRDANSVIRRILRSPMKIGLMSSNVFFKRAILAFGNSICCPTVTYNKELLDDSVFSSDLKFDIDWDTFLKLAEKKGRFLYKDKPLVLYRIHDGATSKEFIDNHSRIIEDRIMFGKFYPPILVNLIMFFYKLAYKTYG